MNCILPWLREFKGYKGCRGCGACRGCGECEGCGGCMMDYFIANYV